MENELEVLSINISPQRGTVKVPVDKIRLVVGEGIPDDAHHGPWHPQISMLGKDSIDRYANENNRSIGYGDFAENLTVQGMKITDVAVFDRFINDQIELEVSQPGKKCQGDDCRIYQETGECIMSTEGVFLRVKNSGDLSTGDRLTYRPKVFEIMIITISDRASAGIYEDLSGPRIAELTRKYFQKAGRMCELKQSVIPDDPDKIEKGINLAYEQQFDIIFTTGGTGIGPRDYTPDVVKSMLDKEISGIMEMIRVKYGMGKPNALLSRGVAGTIGTTLVYTLPGSVKAVNEYCEEIFKTLNHSLMMVNGLGDH